jgi:hypothetical protein
MQLQASQMSWKILKVCDKSKEPLFPKQNFDAHNKEDAQYVFSMYRIL